jgi:hypothetical protein
MSLKCFFYPTNVRDNEIHHLKLITLKIFKSKLNADASKTICLIHLQEYAYKYNQWQQYTQQGRYYKIKI